MKASVFTESFTLSRTVEDSCFLEGTATGIRLLSNISFCKRKKWSADIRSNLWLTPFARYLSPCYKSESSIPARRCSFVYLSWPQWMQTHSRRLVCNAGANLGAENGQAYWSYGLLFFFFFPSIVTLIVKRWISQFRVAWLALLSSSSKYLVYSV